MGRRGYRRDVWGMVAGTTIALGLACAVMVWGLSGPVTTCLALSLSAFLMAVLAEKGLATATRAGCKFGLVLVAGGGLVGALGWFGLLLVLAVMLTSPLARILLWTGRLRGLVRPGLARDETTLVDDVEGVEALGRAPEGATGAVSRRLVLLADLPDAGDMPELDDPGLCEAWRRSYVRLERSRGAARLAVVRLRQLYLDELVRRHPAEVRQWLASGARAAGNPLPYLRRPVRQEQSSEDDWPDDRGSDAA